MNIEFYIPLPPIEFFTWLAIYMQFNMMAFVLVANPSRETESVIKIARYLFIASLCIAPLIIYALIIDWKGSKLYWHRYWMETPAELHARIMIEYDRDI